MKKYSQYLNQLYNNKLLYERSIKPELKNNINRLKEVNDFKGILKEINIIISDIVLLSKNIQYDNIRYTINDNEIEINYTPELSALLLNFKNILIDLQDDWDLMNKIFQDGYRDIFLEITLKGKFNQIDILNGLPNFMKGLGLGQKIYKKLIKDFNFISSFYGVEPSIDSDMVWNKIVDDKEIYSFINDNNFVSFWNDIEFDTIIKKLKEFYKISGNKIYDNDFCIKYNMTQEELEKIIVINEKI